MKNFQNSKTATEMKPKSSHASLGDKQDNLKSKAPDAVPGSIQISSTDNQKVSREDIALVQNLIERCLQLYMSRTEVVKTLLNRARIDPGFTTLVWQKLEEENSEFFRAYYIRLKLKRQIILFNHLLEHQYHLMKYSMPIKAEVSAIHNVINPMPVNNLPLGYPVLRQSLMSAAARHDSAKSAPFSYVVNGVPAPGNFLTIQINPKNDAPDITASGPPTNDASSISEKPVSPPSVGSSGHFSFMPSEIVEINASAVEGAFTSEVANSEGLDLELDGAGCSKGPLGSLGHIPWNFSLSDLTADLENLEDFNALGDYMGSLFLPPDSNILLESPVPDDMVDEFLMDDKSGVRPRSEEEKLS